MQAADIKPVKKAFDLAEQNINRGSPDPEQHKKRCQCQHRGQQQPKPKIDFNARAGF